jgi:hypothetical protein
MKLLIIKSIKKHGRNLVFFYRIITDKGMYKVSFFHKIKMNLFGFVGDRWVLYNFDKNPISEYISEFDFYKSKDINQQYRLIMDDKILFTKLFMQHFEVPTIYGWIKDGEIHSINEQTVKNSDLLNFLKMNRSLIIKPVVGGNGKDVHVINHQGISSENHSRNKRFHLFLDRKEICEDQLESILLKFNNFIITEFIDQHDYAKSLFYKTVNTVRIITIREPKTGKIIIPVAVQRIGREATYPVDNFDRGGLSVEINLDNGVLGRAASRLDVTNSGPTFMEKHPDSKAQISGVKIPYWSELKRKLLETANYFPFLQFIAWDIVITDTGFTVIEINNSSGMKLFQVFGGLKNTPLGDFYRHHKIIN